jgi:hypothetical protein
MGNSQLTNAMTTRFARGTSVAAAISGAIVLLTGCVAGSGQPAPTATPSPSADTSMGDETAAFACGEFSALVGLEFTTRWNVEQGNTSAEAYGQFLERQAFQLSRLNSTDPSIRDAVSDVRTYFTSAAPSSEGWVYDPASSDWLAVQGAMTTACDEAGTPVIMKAESGMGG